MGTRFAVEVQSVFLAYLIVHVLLSAASLLLVWLRANHEPLKSRPPLVVGFLVPFNCFAVVGFCMVGIYREEVSCQLYESASFAFLSALVVMTLVRFSVLYIKFQNAHETVRIAMMKHQSLATLARSSSVLPKIMKAGRSRYAQYRKWIRDRQFIQITVLMMAILNIPLIFLLALPGQNDLTYPCYNSNLASQAFLYLYRCTAGISGVLAAIFFRHEPLDYFWLSGELRVMLSIGFVLFLAYVMCWNVFSEFDHYTFPLSLLLCNVFFSAMLVCSIIYPAFLSYQEQRALTKNLHRRVEGGYNLESVLADQDGRTAFLKFLEMEFSVENLLFKDQVLIYKQQASLWLDSGGDEEDDLALKTMAGEICDEFIVQDSEHWVNLPYALGARVISDLLRWNSLTKEEKINLFDASYDEIVKLLTRDSFSRFVKSPQFRKLVTMSRRAEVIADALQGAKL
eukprot:TRINITY_DN24245_c0_g1_i1.p1 TRINITY_DN24245_c0_g1~~TRINITY_DN24245_c0_g1_i1.p1  ORF type:complete len:455 (-),score=85.30 TRINITY_DN24245_c0_g1_i1:95-1459(-)